MKTLVGRTTRFCFLIGFGVLLNIVYVFGQTMAVFNYDFAVSIGLQEPVNEIN